MNNFIISLCMWINQLGGGADLYAWKLWMLDNGVISKSDFEYYLGTSRNSKEFDIDTLNSYLEQGEGLPDIKYVKMYEKYKDLINSYYAIALAHKEYLEHMRDMFPNNGNINNMLDAQTDIFIAYSMLVDIFIGNWRHPLDIRRVLNDYLNYVGPENFYTITLPCPVVLQTIPYMRVN